MKYQLIKTDLLDAYQKRQKYTLHKHVNKLRKADESFSFAFTRSSVFSSMIEGSSIDLDNYLFNKDASYQTKEMQQVDDLIKAYQFAKSHVFNEGNVFTAAAIMTQNFNIPEQYKGIYRDKNVSVRDWKGREIYKGCAVEEVGMEMDKFYTDITTLCKRKSIRYNEAFYFAAYAHLTFVNIHPFADGNGRMARLIEKWILAQSLKNPLVWKIPAEINYWIKREQYYTNLNRLGKTYNGLDYSRALPFLLMLPASFGISKRYWK